MSVQSWLVVQEFYYFAHVESTAFYVVCAGEELCKVLLMPSVVGNRKRRKCTVAFFVRPVSLVLFSLPGCRLSYIVCLGRRRRLCAICQVEKGGIFLSMNMSPPPFVQ